MWKSCTLTVLLIWPCGALAQGPSNCDAYAKDYAAMMAPRSGAPTLRNSANGLPTAPGTAVQRPQSAMPNEWANMLPNQNAYRRGYEDCMAKNRQ
jgi:hypothetical protein